MYGDWRRTATCMQTFLWETDDGSVFTSEAERAAADAKFFELVRRCDFHAIHFDASPADGLRSSESKVAAGLAALDVRTASSCGFGKGECGHFRTHWQPTSVSQPVTYTFWLHRLVSTASCLRAKNNSGVVSNVIGVCVLAETLLRYLMGDGSSVRQQQLKDFRLPVSLENETKCWSFLETRAQLLLRAYSTTLEVHLACCCCFPSFLWRRRDVFVTFVAHKRSVFIVINMIINIFNVT